LENKLFLSVSGAAAPIENTGLDRFSGRFSVTIIINGTTGAETHRRRR
jgi:hypothetical protein